MERLARMAKFDEAHFAAILIVCSLEPLPYLCSLPPLGGHKKGSKERSLALQFFSKSLMLCSS